ncbi:hypothetical protein [Streptomyces sp. NPDC047042]|uniref:hypothetical protein n=1 Tax=Streptomyces sp. NPDC047042 TaxID=3154807 RepID=UPI0033E7521F
MARRALSVTVTVTTLTATTALLLTGCGGGEKSSPDDIKGADSGVSSPSASASVSTSAPAGATRPVVTLPANFQLTFEDWTSGDPEEQALLTDAKEQLRA